MKDSIKNKILNHESPLNVEAFIQKMENRKRKKRILYFVLPFGMMGFIGLIYFSSIFMNFDINETEVFENEIVNEIPVAGQVVQNANARSSRMAENANLDSVHNDTFKSKLSKSSDSHLDSSNKLRNQNSKLLASDHFADSPELDTPVSRHEMSVVNTEHIENKYKHGLHPEVENPSHTSHAVQRSTRANEHTNTKETPSELKFGRQNNSVSNQFVACCKSLPLRTSPLLTSSNDEKLVIKSLPPIIIDNRRNKSALYRLHANIGLGIPFIRYKQLTTDPQYDINSIEKMTDPLESVYFNIGVDRFIGRKIFVGLAIEYYKINEKLEITHVRDSTLIAEGVQRIITSSNGEIETIYGPVYGIRTYQKKYTLHNHTQYVSLPITVGFHKDFKKVYGELSVAMIPTFSIRQSGSVLDNENVPLSFNDAQVRKNPFLLDARVGLKGGVYVNQNLSIGLGFNYRHGLRNMFEDNLGFSKKYGVISTSIGLNYLLH